MLWKGRYRCAVTLSVDFDAETLWSGTFKLLTPSPLSRGDYDIRAGIPRILKLLDGHGIPATFMVPGPGHRRAPRRVQRHQALRRRGRLPRLLPRERAGAPDRRGARADAAGHRPHRGCLRHAAEGQPLAAVRARPQHRRPARGERVRLRLQPVRPRRAVPPARARDRRPAARPRRAAGELGARRRALLPVQLLPVHVGPLDALAGARDLEGGVRRLVRASGGCFLLVVHPFCIGRHPRIALLDQLFTYIKSFPDVWFATHLEVAEEWRSDAGVGRASGRAAGGGAGGVTLQLAGRFRVRYSRRTVHRRLSTLSRTRH